jgi:hypothetical protein
MKKLKFYLDEAEEKKKSDTATRTKVDNLDDLFTPNPDQPLTNKTSNTVPPDTDEPTAPAAPQQNRASQRDTQNRSRAVFTPDMADLLSRMRNIEADPEDPGYPEPEENFDLAHRVDVDNLPAVANNALRAAGIQNPNFHKVANLPGNMATSIRTLGRSLFRNFTSTPTDDIWMVGNLGGRGPNSSEEVNAVANWIRENGQDLGDGNIDFDRTIPGYNAEIHQYVADGIRWLLVQDQFGQYIYSWPEEDSVDPRNLGALGNRQRRLGN